MHKVSQEQFQGSWAVGEVSRLGQQEKQTLREEEEVERSLGKY